MLHRSAVSLPPPSPPHRISKLGVRALLYGRPFRRSVVFAAPQFHHEMTAVFSHTFPVTAQINRHIEHVAFIAILGWAVLCPHPVRRAGKSIGASV